MGKIFAIMPTRNEAERYLDSCLAWLTPMVDEVFIMDDRSEDESVDIARSHGCTIKIRPERVPPFLEHEGIFRGFMWAQFEQTCQPSPADWVLAIDADEFLVDEEGRHDDGPGTTTGTLRGLIAESPPHRSVLLPVAEIFGHLNNGKLLRRTDGFWGGIAGTRLFRYQPNGVYPDKTMGCGAEPTYVRDGNPSKENYGLTLVHLGYLSPDDRIAKYERYTSLIDHGHNNSHIQSILQSPQLVHWDGPVPAWQRGPRV